VNDPLIAFRLGTSLKADAVIFGDMPQYSAKETENETGTSGSERKGSEITCDMKMLLKCQVLLVGPNKIAGSIEVKESQRDSRSSIYSTTISDADRDKMPASELLLLDRCSTDAAKKILAKLKKS
jgi:hypothetical protein